MKNLKKLFLTFIMVFAVLAITACSGTGINKIDEDFLDAGFHQYEYKNSIAVNFDLDRYLKQLENTGSVPEPLPKTVSTSAMFIPVDRMSLELRALILQDLDIVDNGFEDVTSYELNPDVELDVIEGLDYDVYVYADYDTLENEDIDSKTAVIIVFSSEEYLREVLEVSQVIQDQLDGKEVEDHVNGNLLLLVPSNREAHYAEVVEIFNASEK